MIRRIPPIGQRVRINKSVSVHGGQEGVVIENDRLGCCGRLLALRMDDGRTVDIFWSRVRPVELNRVA